MRAKCGLNGSRRGGLLRSPRHFGHTHPPPPSQTRLWQAMEGTALTTDAPMSSPANRSTSEFTHLRRHLADEGYCYIENVIPADQIDRVGEEVKRDVLAHSLLEPPKGYVPGLLRVNQSLAPYLAHSRVLGLAEAVFGPHVRISMLTGSVNAPGLPRGPLHADWPFNQNSQAHVPAPYPDVVMHLVSFWMLTDFTEENGATIVVPQSHKNSGNPSGETDVSPDEPYPGEARLTGKAGTIAVFDARLWHAEAPNVSDVARVGVLVRYAPWWLNLDTLRPGTVDHQDIVEANDGGDSRVPALKRDVYERLPDDVKPLVRYSVDTSP